MKRSEAAKRLTEKLQIVAALQAVQSSSAEDQIFARALHTALAEARDAAHAYETADSDGE